MCYVTKLAHYSSNILMHCNVSMLCAADVGYVNEKQCNNTSNEKSRTASCVTTSKLKSLKVEYVTYLH